MSPIIANVVIMELPPKLMNGSVMPMMERSRSPSQRQEHLEREHRDDGPGDDGREEAVRDGDHLDPAPDDEGVEERQDGCAEEASLLGEQAKMKTVACSGR